MRQRLKTSSARAAQSVLNAEGKLTTVGFGGFVGSEAVDEATTADFLALSGEYQSLLKQLSKRNAATKIKALQGLEARLREDTVEIVKLVLRQWLLSYRSLTRDLESAVRQKTAEVVDVMVTRLKRDLAPFLKGLIGPWWVAQYDVHDPTAHIARSTFQGVFVGEKATKALIYGATELSTYLAETLVATPETIADPNKESAGDREVKWEAVMRATLCATTGFLEHLASSLHQETVSEAVERIGDVLLSKVLLKRLLNAPLVAIRRDAYKALQPFCHTGSKLLSDRAALIAPVLFNSLSEKNPDCHNPMWDLLLTVIKECPEVWNHVSVEKSVVPKLCSFLRHGGYGSAEHSYNAVMPFVSQIPSEHWHGTPSLLIQIFHSAWDGAHTAHDALVRPTLVLLHECILWGLLTAATSIPDASEEAFRRALIDRTLHERVLSQILDRGSEGHGLALQLLSQTLCSLASASVKATESKTPLKVLEHLSRGISEKLIPEWSHQGGAGEVLEAICEVYEAIGKVENVSEAAKGQLLEVFVQPTAAIWTDEAFSDKHQSQLYAQYLLRSSRIFDTPLIHFQQHEAKDLPLNLLRAIPRHSPGESVLDLLVFVLSRHPVETRQDQWAMVLRELFPRDMSPSSEALQFLMQLLLRFRMFLEGEPVVSLVSTELDGIAEHCVQSWAEDLTSGQITALLIQTQSTLLSHSCYSTLLESITGRLESPVEGNWQEGSYRDVVSALVSQSATQGLPSDSAVAKKWALAVVAVMGMLWGTDPFPAILHTVWEQSQFLTEIDPALSHLLASHVQPFVICLTPQIKFPDGADVSECGRILAQRLMDVMRIPGTQVGPLLQGFFQSVDWCHALIENEDSTEASRQGSVDLADAMCMCASWLVQQKGVEIFREIPSLRGRIFLTILSSDLAASIAGSAIAQEVLNEIIEYGDNSLAWFILAESLSNSLFTLSEAHYDQAAHRILDALIKESENLAVLKVLEKSCTLLHEAVKQDVARLWEADLDVSDEEARSGQYLQTLVPIIRRSSLASVCHAGLNQITVPCMEACIKYFEMGATGCKNTLYRVWSLVYQSFPLETPCEDVSLFSTPAERQTLIRFTQASVAYSGARELRMWQTCVFYAAQDFSYEDWNMVLSLICAKMKERAVKCEEICEDYTDLAVQHLSECVPTADVSTPTMALQLLHRLPKNLTAIQFSSLIDWKWDDSDAGHEREWMATLMEWMALLVFSAQSRDRGANWDAALMEKLREGIYMSLRVVLCFGISCSIDAKANGHCTQTYETANIPSVNLSAIEKLFGMAFEDRSLLKEAVEGVDVWSETTGVDAITALLQICFPSLESTDAQRCDHQLAFQSHGLKLLGSEMCMGKLIHEDHTTEAGFEAQMQGEGALTQNEILLAAGVHPELAEKLEKLSGSDLLLVWALLLMHLETGSQSHRLHVSHLLRNLPSLIQNILNCLTEMLPEPPVKSQKKAGPLLADLKRQLERAVMRRDVFTLQELIESIGAPQSEKEWTVLAMKMYHVMLVTFPVSVRLWFHDLKAKHRSEAIQLYTMQCETPQLIKQEFEKIPDDTQSAASNLKIRGNLGKREIVATIQVEDSTAIDLCIKLPDCMPLKAMTVECDVKMKIQDAKLRKWIFSVSAFLANHSGSVMDAIEIWNRSLHELKSLETCLICFSILHPTSKRTPDLSCRTCHLKFHSACLYTWFRQSAKSLCPHCQAPWAA